MKLTEAFRALNALNEDTFSVSDDGIAKLAEFEQNDDLADDISVIDPEAETEEDLEDSYVGKIILDCTVCHSKLYKDIEEIELDEEQTLANVGEECPYCYTSDGFKVLGQVSAFGGKTEDTDSDDDADASAESDDDEVDEALNEGIFGSKSQDYKGFTIQKQKGQFKITGVPSNSDVSVEEVRPYSAKSFDDMKRIIDTKVLAQLSDADKSRISKEREMQAAAAEHRLDKGESDARNYQQELKDRKRHSIERELDRNRKPVKNNKQYNAVTDRYSGAKNCCVVG